MCLPKKFVRCPIEFLTFWMWQTVSSWNCLNVPVSHAFCQLLLRYQGSVRIFFFFCKNKSQVVVLLLGTLGLVRRARGCSPDWWLQISPGTHHTVWPLSSPPPHPSRWPAVVSVTHQPSRAPSHRCPASVFSPLLAHVFLSRVASIKSHLLPKPFFSFPSSWTQLSLSEPPWLYGYTSLMTHILDPFSHLSNMY